MNLSALQMSNQFFPTVVLRTNPQFVLKSQTAAEFKINLSPRTQESDPRAWQLCLQVELSDDKESPYGFLVVSQADFRVLDSVADNEVQQFALINGASILFGTIRELLTSITARGQYGPLKLPLFQFTKDDFSGQHNIPVEKKEKCDSDAPSMESRPQKEKIRSIASGRTVKKRIGNAGKVMRK